MSLFGKLVKTAVNVVVLPVAIVKDTVMTIPDVVENRQIFTRTGNALQTIKDEADD